MKRKNVSVCRHWVNSAAARRIWSWSEVLNSDSMYSNSRLVGYRVSRSSTAPSSRCVRRTYAVCHRVVAGHFFLLYGYDCMSMCCVVAVLYLCIFNTRNWSNIATHLVVVVVLLPVVVVVGGDLFKKAFKIRSEWNLAWLFPELIPINRRTRFSDMKSYFQNGGHDVISCISAVLPPSEWKRSVCRVHLQQRTSVPESWSIVHSYYGICY